MKITSYQQDKGTAKLSFIYADNIVHQRKRFSYKSSCCLDLVLSKNWVHPFSLIFVAPALNAVVTNVVRPIAMRTWIRPDHHQSRVAKVYFGPHSSGKGNNEGKKTLLRHYVRPSRQLRLYWLKAELPTAKTLSPLLVHYDHTSIRRITHSKPHSHS